MRPLLESIPVRLVAASHETSVAGIEATYSKYITHPGADLMRGALLDLDPTTPATAAVVPLTRAA